MVAPLLVLSFYHISIEPPRLPLPDDEVHRHGRLSLAAANIVTANPGAPIAYTYLDPITTARTYVAINAKAQKPNAAKLFVNWIASKEGLEVYSRARGGAPTR